MERDGTSASTGALLDYLAASAHPYTVVDLDHPDQLTERLGASDVVLNAVHGHGGEDGGLQFLCDLANVPVTGPAGWVHALAADKRAFKAFATNYVPMPPDADEAITSPTGFIRKPRFGGGSIGLVYDPSPQYGWKPERDLVDEVFIPGAFVTCCIYPALKRTLPLLWVIPTDTSGLYTLGDKRGGSHPVYRLVAPGETTWATSIDEQSRRLHAHLGGRGPIRFDWIVDRDDKTWLLEANTNPGWRPTGNMGQVVTGAGYHYSDLVETVIAEAVTD
jgi:D-alanine-D-alanine ligase